MRPQYPQEHNQLLPAHPVRFTLAVLAYALLMWFIVFSVANAETLINTSVIIQIESMGNPLAYNPGHGEKGLMQITPGVLKEYNDYHKIKYTSLNLFIPNVNIKIGEWYLNKRIPQMLKYYHLPVTTENIIKAYNAGIKSVIKGYTPRITAWYLKKYQRLAKLEGK